MMIEKNSIVCAIIMCFPFFIILILEILLQDGEVGKEIFLKQLRSVVGDAMLRSIIHGMHG